MLPPKVKVAGVALLLITSALVLVPTDSVKAVAVKLMPFRSSKPVLVTTTVADWPAAPVTTAR